VSGQAGYVVPLLVPVVVPVVVLTESLDTSRLQSDWDKWDKTSIYEGLIVYIRIKNMACARI